MYLKYRGKPIKLQIDNVPRLTRVSFGSISDPLASHTLNLLNIFCQVTTLRLQLLVELGHEMEYPFPVLSNLKCLYLDVMTRVEHSVLPWVAAFISVSPVLEKLLFRVTLTFLDMSNAIHLCHYILVLHIVACLLERNQSIIYQNMTIK